jgi:hypothetical protein
LHSDFEPGEPTKHSEKRTATAGREIQRRNFKFSGTIKLQKKKKRCPEQYKTCKILGERRILIFS